MSLDTLFDALKYRIEVDQHGTRRYYNSADQLHRVEGPAVEYTDGTKVWLINGRRQREDGPALIMSDGTQMWFRNGSAHRIDGPAVICANGNVSWYLSGNRLTQQEFNSCIKSGEYNEP